jgi:hypothetical protein
MVDVARALMGLGAAFKNEVPQFQQRMQQEDLYKMKMADMDMARQDALLKREEERKKTLFQDAATARQYFDRGDFGSIADIARDRLEILTPMGVNTRDSQQMLQLADAARAGDPTAIKGLKDQLDTIYSVGSLYNVYGSGSTPASFRALELQGAAGRYCLKVTRIPRVYEVWWWRSIVKEAAGIDSSTRMAYCTILRRWQDSCA